MGKAKKMARGLPTAKTAQARPSPTPAAKGAAPKPQTVINAGTFAVPGGTITVTDKGISTYTGDPYRVIPLRHRYTQRTDDRDARGIVKMRMGK